MQQTHTGEAVTPASNITATMQGGSVPEICLKHAGAIFLSSDIKRVHVNPSIRVLDTEGETKQVASLGLLTATKCKRSKVGG